MFGAKAQVNVRGMLASTLAMDNAGFMAGSHVLQRSSSARVLNEGSLTAAEGGYVALVGRNVINVGNITARGGDALLAAGTKVTLQLEDGSLVGYNIDLGRAGALVEIMEKGVVSAAGGRVVLDAQATDALVAAGVNNAGIIEAQTLEGKACSAITSSDMAG